MNIALHKSMLGTSRHIMSAPEGFVLVDDIPPEVWTVGDPSAHLRVEDLSALFDEPLPLVADMAHVTSLKSLNLADEDVVPWHFVLSRDNFTDRVSRLLASADELRQRILRSGYSSLLLQHKSFLSSLSPIAVDVDRLAAHLVAAEGNPSRLSCLRSFEPDSAGFAPTIVYTQDATVTGRLTVQAGPKILTLPADARDIIRSRYDGGCVYSVDFVSLEPRVIKSITSPDSAPLDIYTHVQNLIGDSTLPRGDVKKLIISCIYGASRARLREMAGSANVSRVSSVIGDYFGLEDLGRRLQECHDEFGHIVNFFGRPINDDKSDNRTWLSHYAQSTSVDLALDAFFTLSQQLQASMSLPVAIIHDAILFDVPPGADALFKSVTDQLLPTRLGPFPVSRTEITRRNNV